MKKSRSNIPLFANFTCLLFLITALIATSGCTPLRKKFTREKKENKENDPRFNPVLDPIDYPEKVLLSKDKYNHHYSLWKVWDKDLLQNLAVDSSDKRQKYLLTQSIEHLNEMSLLLDSEKRVGLEDLIKVYHSALEEYEKPEAMRNKITLRRKIERNGRAVRNSYAPNLMKEYWEQ